MSTVPDNELDLDKLFLPAWAQEPAASKYSQYEGTEEVRHERRGGDRYGGRGPRRDGGDGGRRENRRPGGERRGGPPGDRPAGRGGRPGERDRGVRPGGAPRRDERREQRPPPAPLPELEVSLVPEEKGVESLARQIKMTGRAFPLFDIAQMILQKPERHSVTCSVKKKPDGEPIQPLFVCALDDSLWLSEEEAVSHVLRKHFATFYQADRTATEPPKGKYTFVAQCGLSGHVLGPPNHHDYQNQLRKLHSERFSRMPFEAFKSRVKIVRDEEVVKKWVEDQSWKTEYVCLNLPEPLRLPNMEAVEKHFRETHKENIIKKVESHTMNGAAARNVRSPDLARLIRMVWEDQRRFPLQVATVLSQQFAGHGLQFFKVNRTVTHVCVARPHYLDLAAAPVSEGIKKIVEYIDSHPKSNRKQLVEALAPSPAPAPAAAPAAAPSAEGQPAATPVPATPQATPEQTAVVSDLHWLIHQGHVIEFANGVLETAKKPAPRPPKPQPKTPTAPESTAPAAPAEAQAAETGAALEPAAPAGEVTGSPEAPSEAPPAETPSATPAAAETSAPEAASPATETESATPAPEAMAEPPAAPAPPAPTTDEPPPPGQN